MTSHPPHPFYPSEDLSYWLRQPPLRVIADLHDDIQTLGGIIRAEADVLLRRPNIDSIDTFDRQGELSLMETLKHVIDHSHSLHHLDAAAYRFFLLCRTDKTKIRYLNNAQTDFDFQISGKGFEDVRSAVDRWLSWPSPLAVIYTMCTGITTICERIQALVVPLMAHEMFYHEKRLDRSEKLTFVYLIQGIYQCARDLKYWVNFGLQYRTAFLKGDIQFSPEELMRTEYLST